MCCSASPQGPNVQGAEAALKSCFKDQFPALPTRDFGQVFFTFFIKFLAPVVAPAAGFAAHAAPPTVQSDASRDARIFTEMKQHHLVQ